jgi:glycine cleavage system regulatory protein
MLLKLVAALHSLIQVTIILGLSLLTLEVLRSASLEHREEDLEVMVQRPEELLEQFQPVPYISMLVVKDQQEITLPVVSTAVEQLVKVTTMKVLVVEQPISERALL